jgi:cell division protein FtsQ
LREVGPGPDVWWLADNPPAPRPALDAAASGLQRRRRLGFWVLGAAALVLLGNPELRAISLAQVDRGLELAGLGLQQVTVSGHRYTSDTDIYAALRLDGARTLLSFDAGGAKARIEQLPWVEKVSIERVVPDAIDVRVSERTPFAVWRDGEKSWLIDARGRKLQLAPADVMPQLPRLSGDAAGSEAAALVALLADYPAIARKVEVAERVAGRRWTLHIAGGTTVDLPAEREDEALAQLTRLNELGLGGARRIDLRAPARTLIDGLDQTSTAARVPEAPEGRS